jgi:aspartyl-tRNA(Asn)/glutamyl-tRNA(Gln) amidotransferase subunit A
MKPFSECSATELNALYRAGEARPSEVVQDVLSLIDAKNPVLNAFRVIDHDGVMQAARASDQRWQDLRPQGLLDGVPVSVKDIILTRGLSTLRGSQSVDPNQAWDTDAPCVARLREAGALILGKTTTPEFGCKGTTDSFLTGVTRNPYNTEMTPGGSSGGAAAAIAARLGPLALGTDGAGSIRIPSAFCGVTGIKASFGRVPAYPSSPFGTLAHIGPHARSVRDLALALNVISRDDVRDWFALPSANIDFLDGLDQGVDGLRVAYSPALGHATVDPEVARATRRAAACLEGLGAVVEEVDPGFSDPLDLICALWFVGSATLLAGIPAEKHALLDPALLWQAEEGRKLSAVDLSRIGIRRAELGRLMREFHLRYDLLLTPSVAITAMPVAQTGSMQGFTPEAFLGWTPFSYPFNLTQQPALSLPAGLAANGLPVSVQLVGAMHQDALVLRAGAALEMALGPMPAPS